MKMFVNKYVSEIIYLLNQTMRAYVRGALRLVRVPLDSGKVNSFTYKFPCVNINVEGGEKWL